MGTQRIGCNWVLVDFSKHRAPGQLDKLEHEAKNHLSCSMILKSFSNGRESTSSQDNAQGKWLRSVSWLGGDPRRSARTDLGSSVVTLAIAKCETTLPCTGGLEFPEIRHDGRDLASPIRKDAELLGSATSKTLYRGR